MPRFSRLFLGGLQRLFPSAGIEAPYPNDVSDSVQWTKDLTAWGFHNNIRMRRLVTFAAGAGVDLELSLGGPDAGFFMVPVSLTVWNGSAVNGAAYGLFYESSGVSEDPWGAWDDTTRYLWQGRIPASLSASVSAVETVPVLLPLTRGWRQSVMIFGAVAGVTYRAHYYWMDVPGDLISLEHFAARGMSAQSHSSY